jgi:hypothetical protein
MYIAFYQKYPLLLFYIMMKILFFIKFSILLIFAIKKLNLLYNYE